MGAKIRITFVPDAHRENREIKLGAFAQIASKRKFGLDAVKSSDPEVLLYGAFIELEGPQAGTNPDAFDAWLMLVEDVDVVSPEADPENPPPAETPSSDTSPESPPTSE